MGEWCERQAGCQREKDRGEADREVGSKGATAAAVVRVGAMCVAPRRHRQANETEGEWPDGCAGGVRASVSLPRVEMTSEGSLT